MPDEPTTLTYGLRQLVWGIESEVAVITSLSRRIDAHVTALNGLRAELAERLVRLDALRESVADEHLVAFVEQTVVTPLPSVDEEFPELLYGT